MLKEVYITVKKHITNFHGTREAMTIPSSIYSNDTFLFKQEAISLGSLK